MRTVKYVGFLILSFFILILIAQNTDVVSFHFLAWELSLSLIVLMPLLLLTGFVLGFLVAKWTSLRGGRRAD